MSRDSEPNAKTNSVAGDSPAGEHSQVGHLNRRHLLAALSGLGIGTATFARALAQQAEAAGVVTAEMVAHAEWIAGLELTDEERAKLAEAASELQNDFTAMRRADVGYDVPPALVFDPTLRSPVLSPNVFLGGMMPGMPVLGGVAPLGAGPIVPGNQRGALDNGDKAARSAPMRPKADDDLAFLPTTELAGLLRTRQISSVELTKIYLARLKKYDPQLHCVVTLTEELALNQARLADDEIEAGRYRGPLHGVPWGAKDLIAVAGYPTTWGAPQFREQKLNDTATVARRLAAAGAVLVAKLSLGALAWGDLWFGGMTRNPWNLAQGSSGSSAGSASAAAAGLCGFTLGSETLGSIVSPCRRCGTTGLRPTFGRVSRHGCMSLAWSMDKIGPITRSVEDCAFIFDAIYGPDGLDATVHDRPFTWPRHESLSGLRVGHFPENEGDEERETHRVLRSLGVELVPIKLPDRHPIDAMTIILNVEAAAVFDTLTREKDFDGLNRWPGAFHQGEFVPAVEYLRANRLRTLLIRDMAMLMKTIDLYVGGDDLALTNLTGHPTVVVPNGLVERDGVSVSTSVTFTGRLFDETTLLAVAHAYQQATGHHLKRPPLS